MPLTRTPVQASATRSVILALMMILSTFSAIPIASANLGSGTIETFADGSSSITVNTNNQAPSTVNLSIDRNTTIGSASFHLNYDSQQTPLLANSPLTSIVTVNSNGTLVVMAMAMSGNKTNSPAVQPPPQHQRTETKLGYIPVVGGCQSRLFSHPLISRLDSPLTSQPNSQVLAQ